MSGYLVGLVLVLAWLVLQTLGSRLQYKATIQMFKALCDMVGAIGELPQDKLDEMRKVWSNAEDRAKQSSVAASCWALVALAFLVALLVHGKL